MNSAVLLWLINELPTTPGKQRSVSIFGPSEATGGEPEESDDESGDDGMEEFEWPILTVII